MNYLLPSLRTVLGNPEERRKKMNERKKKKEANTVHLLLCMLGNFSSHAWMAIPIWILLPLRYESLLDNGGETQTLGERLLLASVFVYVREVSAIEGAT